MEVPSVVSGRQSDGGGGQLGTVVPIFRDAGQEDGGGGLRSGRHAQRRTKSVPSLHRADEEGQEDGDSDGSTGGEAEAARLHLPAS